MTERVLELFCGLGGMRTALTLLGIPIDAVVAVDLAVEGSSSIYRNTWGDDVVNKDITSLPVGWFEAVAASIWTLSPPCQPYTRQGSQRDTEDPRAAALLHLCAVLEEISRLPKLIVLENVEGFEKSESCRRFVSILKQRGYRSTIHLSNPLSLGFPNSRSRCFIVASLRDTINLANVDCTSACSFVRRSVGDYLHSTDDQVVPDSVLDKPSSIAMDIVSARSLQSMCFTRGYGRQINGSGSVLYTGDYAPSWDEMQRPLFNLNRGEMKQLSGKLRFFCPDEIASLQGFSSKPGQRPECLVHGKVLCNTSIPPLQLGQLGCRAAFRALGNSLNPWSVAFAIIDHIQAPSC